MFPIGNYEDVAAGCRVSVGVCTVDGLFKSLFESVRCVFRECQGCAWPGCLGIRCSPEAGVSGVM